MWMNGVFSNNPFTFHQLYLLKVWHAERVYVILTSLNVRFQPLNCTNWQLRCSRPLLADVSRKFPDLETILTGRNLKPSTQGSESYLQNQLPCCWISKPCGWSKAALTMLDDDAKGRLTGTSNGEIWEPFYLTEDAQSSSMVLTKQAEHFAGNVLTSRIDKDNGLLKQFQMRCWRQLRRRYYQLILIAGVERWKTLDWQRCWEPGAAAGW